MYNDVITFIKKLYDTDGPIPLHESRFFGNEKKYLSDCIDSKVVSTIGSFVNRFESEIANFTGSKYAIATVNGTSALHIALLLAGVEANDEVITQPLTFVATVNAISYAGAQPIFVDVDTDSLGMSPEKLEHFLKQNTSIINEKCINNKTKKQIKAVLPMHTFGLPLRIDEIISICNNYHIKVIEDAAEALGSRYKNQHAGTFGLIGTFSFNGNKTLTCGGGGMIVTDDELLAKKAKHLTTTAKIPHQWYSDYDAVGFNYRMPNLNAALGCAQMENLGFIIEQKRNLADQYSRFFDSKSMSFISEIDQAKSNFWLNALQLESLEQRNEFLKVTNAQNIMTRPVWKLMSHLTMYKHAQIGNLDNSIWIEKTVVNLPSTFQI